MRKLHETLKVWSPPHDSKGGRLWTEYSSATVSTVHKGEASYETGVGAASVACRLQDGGCRKDCLSLPYSRAKARTLSRRRPATCCTTMYPDKDPFAPDPDQETRGGVRVGAPRGAHPEKCKMQDGQVVGWRGTVSTDAIDSRPPTPLT